MNNIRLIIPYKHGSQWVFDDTTRGLLREPFVGGTDLIIDAVTKNITNAEDGFALLFSDTPFPGYNYLFNWDAGEYNGDWYVGEGMRGWLCPALLKYFDEAPHQLYVQVRAR